MAEWSERGGTLRNADHTHHLAARGDLQHGVAIAGREPEAAVGGGEDAVSVHHVECVGAMGDVAVSIEAEQMGALPPENMDEAVATERHGAEAGERRVGTVHGPVAVDPVHPLAQGDERSAHAVLRPSGTMA